MRVLIENIQDKFPVTESTYDLIEEAAKACLYYEDYEENVEISISLVDNQAIREINLEHRCIDKETDVLSFPILEFEEGYRKTEQGDYRKGIVEGFKVELEYHEGVLLLGDIVISLEKALEQAEEYGHSYERELAFLVCHSMFHLFGYDHMDEEDEKIMIQKQEAVLSKLGYVR